MLKRLCGFAAAFATCGTVAMVHSQTKSLPDLPTFARDVAPILQEHCQSAPSRRRRRSAICRRGSLEPHRIRAALHRRHELRLAELVLPVG